MAARGAVVARNIAEAREKLASIAARDAGPSPRLVFLFPGQGSQHPNMASALIDTEPVFRDAFDKCCALASERLGRDLRKLILPGTHQNGLTESALMETRYTQPALFAVEYALAELWESWGYRPVSMIGHSIGEYVAACRAGVFPLEVAVALVVARGAAMFAQPPGSMLAVHAGESDVAQRLPHGVEIAALNAPDLTVVAGTGARSSCLPKLLRKDKVESDAASRQPCLSFFAHGRCVACFPSCVRGSQARTAATRILFVRQRSADYGGTSHFAGLLVSATAVAGSLCRCGAPCAECGANVVSRSRSGTSADRVDARFARRSWPGRRFAEFTWPAQ